MSVFDLFWPGSRPRPGWRVKHHLRGAGGIASSAAVGTPTITIGPKKLFPPGITAPVGQVGVPSVTIAAAVFNAGGIDGGTTFGVPQVNMAVALTGITSGESVPAPAISTVVGVTVGAGIGTAEAVGTPALASTYAVGALGVESEQFVGTPTVTGGPVNLLPASIGTGEAVGTPALIYAQPVAPAGIASGETFGEHFVATDDAVVFPVGIPTAEAFGTAVLSRTLPVPGIASGEAFGGAALIPGGVSVSASGIASTETFGTSSLASVYAVTGVGGVASSEVFGTAQLNQKVVCTGIASGESVPSPAAGPGPVSVVVSGIASAEAFGSHTVTAASSLVPFTDEFTRVNASVIGNGWSFTPVATENWAISSNRLVGSPDGDYMPYAVRNTGVIDQSVSIDITQFNDSDYVIWYLGIPGGTVDGSDGLLIAYLAGGWGWCPASNSMTFIFGTAIPIDSLTGISFSTLETAGFEQVRVSMKDGKVWIEAVDTAAPGSPVFLWGLDFNGDGSPLFPGNTYAGIGAFNDPGGSMERVILDEPTTVPVFPVQPAGIASAEAFGTALLTRSNVAPTYVNGASGITSTATMPAHQVGDMLQVTVFRDGSTAAPTVPSGWTAVATAAANSCFMGVYIKFAASTSEVTGTWTSATGVEVEVWRNVGGIGAVSTGTGTAATITYPALTMTNSGTNWIQRKAGCRNATNLTTNTPAGYTSRAGNTTEVRGIDTNGAVSSPGTATQSTNGSTGWVAITMELLTVTATSLAGIVLSDDFNTGSVPSTTRWATPAGWSGGTVASGVATATVTSALQTNGFVSIHAIDIRGRSLIFKVSGTPGVSGGAVHYLGLYEGYHRSINPPMSAIYFATTTGTTFAPQWIQNSGSPAAPTGASNITHTSGNLYRIDVSADGATVKWSSSTNGGTSYTLNVSHTSTSNYVPITKACRIFVEAVNNTAVSNSISIDDPLICETSLLPAV